MYMYDVPYVFLSLTLCLLSLSDMYVIASPFSQVWTPVPMAMICSALFLTIAPLVYVPQERGYLLLGLALVLTGVPVYLLLVWDKYRPALISRITGKYSVMIVVHVYIFICLYVYLTISNISGCACIPTVKKHALISEGVLIFECFVQ